MAGRKPLTPEQRDRKNLLERQRREMRKAQFRCVQCGEQDARTLEGMALCAECREKSLEARHRRGGYSIYSMYDLRKKNHLCTKCGKQDAYTLAGRAYCFECNEHKNELQRARRAKDPEKERERCRAQYYAKKDKCVCIECGKPLDRFTVRCRKCSMKKSRKRLYKIVADKQINYPRGDNGFCWRCNKKPAMEGKRLCPECYAAAVNTMKTAVLPKAKQSEYLKTRSERSYQMGQLHRAHRASAKTGKAKLRLSLPANDGGKK